MAKPLKRLANRAPFVREEIWRGRLGHFRLARLVFVKRAQIEAYLAPGSFPALLAGLANDGVCRVSRTEIKFFNGSSIKLCHLENPATDVFSYEGSAFQLLILDETTSIPGEGATKVRSRGLKR